MGCYGDVNVDVHVKTTFYCSQKSLGKVAKVGGH